MKLTQILKSERTRLLNRVAAIDLLLEASGEEIPDEAPQQNGKPAKAPRITGQEEQVLFILREGRRAMSIREITKKMPARFKSSEHKNSLQSRVGAACARMVKSGAVAKRGKAVYEASAEKR
jgi:hypothetical protein